MPVPPTLKRSFGRTCATEYMRNRSEERGCLTPGRKAQPRSAVDLDRRDCLAYLPRLVTDRLQLDSQTSIEVCRSS